MTSRRDKGAKMQNSQAMTLVLEPRWATDSSGTPSENTDARGTADTVPFSVVPPRRARLVKVRGGRWTLSRLRY
jgi:hypothetical protein